MIKFPLTELLDDQACYEWLMKVLHPQGLHCPNGHEIPLGQAPHDRKRAPIVKYRCRECGRVFNIFTGTDLSGSHYNSSQIVMNRMLTIAYLILGVSVKLFATLRASMLVMKIKMVVAKSIAILWRVFGLVYATLFVHFAVSIKSICISM